MWKCDELCFNQKYIFFSLTEFSTDFILSSASLTLPSLTHGLSPNPVIITIYREIWT